MKMLFMLIWTLVIPSKQSATSIYMCRDLKAGLFSEAPLENIEAASQKGISVINLTSGEVQFSIPVKSFVFSKNLMQEHFNENYMESDKYPAAKFTGKINEKIATGKDGDYQVTVSGDLEIHGVKQKRTIAGIIKLNNNLVSINSTFNVLCKDHRVKIPTMVFKNIAESIRISISGNYTPYTSTKP